MNNISAAFLNELREDNDRTLFKEVQKRQAEVYSFCNLRVALAYYDFLSKGQYVPIYWSVEKYLTYKNRKNMASKHKLTYGEDYDQPLKLFAVDGIHLFPRGKYHNDLFEYSISDMSTDREVLAYESVYSYEEYNRVENFLGSYFTLYLQAIPHELSSEKDNTEFYFRIARIDEVDPSEKGEGDQLLLV